MASAVVARLLLISFIASFCKSVGAMASRAYGMVGGAGFCTIVGEDWGSSEFLDRNAWVKFVNDGHPNQK